MQIFLIFLNLKIWFLYWIFTIFSHNWEYLHWIPVLKRFLCLITHLKVFELIWKKKIVHFFFEFFELLKKKSYILMDIFLILNWWLFHTLQVVIYNIIWKIEFKMKNMKIGKTMFFKVLSIFDNIFLKKWNKNIQNLAHFKKKH